MRDQKASRSVRGFAGGFVKQMQERAIRLAGGARHGNLTGSAAGDAVRRLAGAHLCGGGFRGGGGKRRDQKSPVAGEGTAAALSGDECALAAGLRDGRELLYGMHLDDRADGMNGNGSMPWPQPESRKQMLVCVFNAVEQRELIPERLDVGLEMRARRSQAVGAGAVVDDDGNASGV